MIVTCLKAVTFSFTKSHHLLFIDRLYSSRYRTIFTAFLFHIQLVCHKTIISTAVIAIHDHNSKNYWHIVIVPSGNICTVKTSLKLWMSRIEFLGQFLLAYYRCRLIFDWRTYTTCSILTCKHAVYVVFLLCVLLQWFHLH